MDNPVVATKVSVKKGDTVMVIAGKEKGKKGRVLEVYRGSGTILVEKINIIKRHTRPSQKYKQGGIIDRESPIHTSNTMVICSKCGKPSRTGIKTLKDGSKVRYCKKCDEVIDKG